MASRCLHGTVLVDCSELERDVLRVQAGALQLPTVSAVRITLPDLDTFDSVVFLSCEDFEENGV
jgi:hypothetical protein